MKGTTHLAAGCLAASLIPGITAPAAAGLILGSVLPDIDSKKSLVGRHVPVLPRLLPHRTVTHGLAFMLLLGCFFSPLGMGIGLHILMDMCTPEGVKLFWPFGRNCRIPGINHIMKSGGLLDRGLGWALWATAMVSCVCMISGHPIPTLF